jgi:pimeloyl-ACP methyl ester carboxylesterase
MISRIAAQLLVGSLVFVGLGLSIGAVHDVAVADEGATRETVVLLHGLGRTRMAMWPLAARLEKAGFNVVRIGYDSLRQTPAQILAEVSRQIDLCCRNLPQPVHFVGHSLGGLMIRAYLSGHEVRSRGRVVLIATPNAGTPLVDAYRDAWWMDLAGPTAKSLGTGQDSFPNALPEPDYPVGVIAGTRVYRLLGDLIPGEHDGLVPLDSTRVDGMVDFVTVDSNHAFLRYSREVARQTIAFLRTGRFQRDH